jgi:hypothetical protein
MTAPVGRMVSRGYTPWIYGQSLTFPLLCLQDQYAGTTKGETKQRVLEDLQQEYHKARGEDDE